MKKKGEITMSYVITMIIALLVLVVVIWIFREQIINFVSEITGLSQDLSGQIDTSGLTEGVTGN